MSDKAETVLVTGAAGTVGDYVVRELLKKGRRVIATDLPGSKFELPKDSPIEVREGDLTDLAFCVDVVAGANSVIHTAASIDLRQPAADMVRINVDAVRYLYEAARARGLRRFVHFSSGSIYQKSRLPIDETTPFDPSSPYEHTKVEAERYLWSRPRSGPEIVILRPTMIYGPRAHYLGAKFAMFPPVLGLIFSKIPRVVGGPRCNWIHAEDVARAAVLVLDEPRAAWEAFNVADDTAVTLGEFIEIATRAYGLPVGRDVPYPTRLFSAIGPILAQRDMVVDAFSIGLEQIWGYISRRHNLVPGISATVDRETFSYATIEVVFDNTKIKRLGFELKYRSLADGYPEVLRWFQERRWVPTYRPGEVREWGGSVGFRFEEKLAGTWRRADEAEARPFRFSFTATAANARQFARDGLLRLDGRVTAGGLADSKPLLGTLDISWRERRRLAYDFLFEGNDGKQYRFEGAQNVELLRFLESMTTLPGRILDQNGREIGQALLRFDLRNDLLAWVTSFAPVTDGGTKAEAENPAKTPAGATA